MATRRTTFAKTQRERDKRAKAAAKRERRAAAADSESIPVDDTADHEKLAAELASLHERYAEKQISFEDFVERRDELQARL